MNPLPIPFPITRLMVPPENFYKGRDGRSPDMIVIHATEASRASTIATFQDASGKSNPAGNVSAHFLVCKTGEIVQFVLTTDTAYGNGTVINPTDPTVIARAGVNPNLYTISIEHELLSGEVPTPAQYNSSANLLTYLSSEWDIPLNSVHVIPHHAIDANKSCPDGVDIVHLLDLANT